MPSLGEVNATVGGRLKDRIRHLGQRTSITLGELGRRRAIANEEAAVILELLAGAGAFQPAGEGDARGPPDVWCDVVHVVLPVSLRFRANS
jgi:hypothetical protein